MRQLFSLILILLPMLLESQPPMIIAHRGASHEAPENTLASVNLAWEKDADAVEIDVHLSKDNRIMVIHDKDTRRTAGVNLVIKESLSSDLRELEVGSFKDPKYAGEKIPFLEEVIETIPDGKTLVIEIKSDVTILPFLAEKINASPKKNQLVVIGFDFDLMAEMKKMLPEVPAYWLHYSLTGGYKTKHIKMGKDAGLEGLNFRFKGISEKFVAAVHDAGMEMYAWTVDDPDEARKLAEIGIDGITTNRPAWLKTQLCKDQQRSEDWIPLFDGKSLVQWRNYNKSSISGWVIEDGSLKALGHGEEKSGDIITVKQYENFELSLEWKISPAGNSGILYLVKEDPAYEAVFETGPEYQLIDDEGWPEPLEEWQKTGANYAMHTAENKILHPAGEWNTSRILVKDGHVEHWLNGRKVVEYQLWTDEWKEKVKAGKWKDFPGYGSARHGHIALQDHGSPAWFRNIKIREL